MDHDPATAILVEQAKPETIYARVGLDQRAIAATIMAILDIPCTHKLGRKHAH